MEDRVNGIALFDHPETAEHPGFFGEIAVPEQISILHHPTDELEDDRRQFTSAVCGT